MGRPCQPATATGAASTSGCPDRSSLSDLEGRSFLCENTHVPPAVGMRFGRFRLLEQLGQGGMAVVYRAVVDGPKGFARAVVIKRILRDCARNPSFVNMLASEARVSALLRHPGIVQVHE